MVVKIIVNMQERGAISRFNVSILRVGDVETQISETYEMNKKAKISFRTTSNNTTDGNKLSISLQKIDVTKNKNELFETKIICKSFGLLKEVVNPHWSDWIDIGALYNRSPCSNCYLYLAEVYVTIFRCTVNTVALVKFFEDRDLTDFNLSTEDGSVVAVHRAYLAAHSDIFKAMLTSKWKETDEGIIEIKGLTLQTLQHFKEYLYLGTLPDDAGLRPLLLLASQYCLEDLKAECITKLAQTVLPENVYSLLDFACDSKLPELSFAVAQMTPDYVIHESYKQKMEAETKKAMNAAASNTE